MLLLGRALWVWVWKFLWAELEVWKNYSPTVTKAFVVLLFRETCLVIRSAVYIYINVPIPGGDPVVDRA